MSRLTIIAATLLACLTLTLDAHAQASAARDMVDEVTREARDKAESKRLDRDARDQAEKEPGDRRIADSDDDSDAESDDDSDSESDDDGDSVRRNSDRDTDRVDSGRLTGPENAATRGNERSREVRSRNDERKAIKDDYSESRELGDSDRRAGETGADDERPEDDSDKKAKKPWWKIWGD